MVVPQHVLIELGSHWSSSLVLAEAELALHRWGEDVAVLQPFGWGASRRSRFEALVDRLRARRDAWQPARTPSVPAPGSKVSSRPPPAVTESPRDDRARARAWLDRAFSILESAELEHREAADALEQIPPPGDGTSTLAASARAALARCLVLRDRLDPDAADDGFFAEGALVGDALAGALVEAPVDPRDRADQLDALDGEIYLTIRGLNRAGRRACAALGDLARGERYGFQFLVTIQRGEEDVTTRRSEPPRAL